MKGQSSRLPSDLAVSVLSAARGDDPQEVFSKDFGAGSIKAPASAVVEPKIEPPVPSAPAPVVEPTPDPSQSVTEAATTNWSRKTYRLRPDQYSTLAALEALLSSENRRRITPSELARQAFDLLFEKHQTMLARLGVRKG